MFRKRSFAVITTSVSALVAALSIASGGTGQTPAPLADTTVLIIRHAEKPDEGEGLTPAGEARSRAYVQYFKSLSLDGKPFRPDHIFATKDSKKSHRERLTVEPLAAALKLTVDDKVKNGGYPELVQDLRTHFYGKNILICWHHGNIPKLAAALGAPTALFTSGKWPDATFDWIVEIKFDAAGQVDLKRTKIIHEHLMPGDSK